MGIETQSPFPPTANGFSQTFSGPSRISHTAELTTADDRTLRDINLRDQIGQRHFLEFALIIVAITRMYRVIEVVDRSR